MDLESKLKIYYFTAILGVVFAVVGFSYNAWRLEKTEDNANIRTAAFEVLKASAELEQIIYAAHYDKNRTEGNPRKGWVKVGLIDDLSNLISASVKKKSGHLKTIWAKNWALMEDDNNATNEIIHEIESVRKEINHVLGELQ